MNKIKEIPVQVMTLRDHFATHAMQALIQSSYLQRDENNTTDDLIEHAFWIADQMLLEREKEE